MKVRRGKAPQGATLKTHSGNEWQSRKKFNVFIMDLSLLKNVNYNHKQEHTQEREAAGVSALSYDGRKVKVESCMMVLLMEKIFEWTLTAFTHDEHSARGRQRG